MQVVRLWLLSLLFVSAGVYPACAQGTGKLIAGVAKSGDVARAVCKTSPRSLKAIHTISKRLVTGSAYAAKVANTPTIPVGIASIQLGKYASLQIGWAARTANNRLIAHNYSVTLPQIAQMLQESSPAQFEMLSPSEQEYMFLYGYPAIAIESPLVLTHKQVDNAIHIYKKVINETSALSGKGNYFENWGKLMSAITNIGLFGSAAEADFVVKGAQKMGGGLLTGPTDVIAVRALLNLKAYDKIQQLADYRLSAVDDTGKPLMLPYEWGEIQQYMQENGLELVIPQERIFQVPDPILSYMPTAEAWLGHYNSYNLFAVDPSAQTTKDWLDLRKGMENKVTALEVQHSIHIEKTLFTPKN